MRFNLKDTSAGSGIYVLAKEPYPLSNEANPDLRFLVIYKPMSHGDRLNA
jgi:hypothetical protein